MHLTSGHPGSVCGRPPACTMCPPPAGLVKQDGSSMAPATITEMAAYFGHVLTVTVRGEQPQQQQQGGYESPGGSRTTPPVVFIAITCDRARGWLTYEV